MNQNFIDEVLRLTNKFRADNGLSPLALNAELNIAAQSYTEEMANGDFFGHNGKENNREKDNVGLRVTEAGYDWNRVGENIAAGYQTPEAVVKGWIDSPGHRRNLLNPDYEDIGLGYYELKNDTGDINYGEYWTQVFGAGDSVAESPAAPTDKPTTENKQIEEQQVPPVLTPEKTADQKAEAPEGEYPAAEDSGDKDANVDPMKDTPASEKSDTAQPEMSGSGMGDPATDDSTGEMPKIDPQTDDASGEDSAKDDMSDMGDSAANSGADTNTDMPMGDMPGMDHGGNTQLQKDHAELERLIDTLKPTHVAAKSGNWSDPATWASGTVPGDNAKVLIEEGVTVNYDVAGSETPEENARIKTIAVQGNLKFPTGKSTKLYVETILNGETGQFNIGSETQGVDADQTVDIIFTSDSGVNKAWDPKQFTKGLVSHGKVNVYGADKLDKVALTGDALAGNNVLTFKEAPTGWQVGDRIVLGGTDITWNGSHKDNSRFQDEVLEITAINGKEIRFVNTDIKEGDNEVLRYDHVRSSRASNVNDLSIYAANLSRNVSFETEGGADVPAENRAHTMFMHNADINIVNARFANLGRSDKRKMVDDIGENVDGTPGNGTNIRGRYMMHFHQTGTGAEKGAANIEGNVLEGGIGWGIVQHESNADIKDNVVFDVVGSGIVAESGNERGSWTDNIVIKTVGVGDYKVIDRQLDERKDKFDLGFEGVAFWVQGPSLIENTDNKAVSFERTGMELFGSVLNIGDRFRPIKRIAIADLPEEVQKWFPEGQKDVDIRDIPASPVRGFEAYNGTIGLSKWGAKTNFDGELGFSSDGEKRDYKTAHLGRSLIEDVKIWNNRWDGLLVRYSSNIDVKDAIILGRDGDRVSGGSGIFNNHAAFNTQFDNVEVAGFNQGARLEFPNNDAEDTATTLKNSTFRDNNYNLTKVGDEGPSMDGSMRPDDYSAYLKLINNTFAEVEGNKAPVARFRSEAIGGLGVKLDASASADSDPLLPDDGTPRPLDSKGIAMYGWDLDNDGDIDRFGRTIEQTFDSAGTKKVKLTVLDSQGQATTTTQDIQVKPTAYSNAFSDGGFGEGTETQEPWKANSRWADEGWYITDNASISNRVANLAKQGTWGNFVGQVAHNKKLHKGKQTFSFRLQNLEGAPEEQYWKKNEVTVKLFGVNGQFDNQPWEGPAPVQVGTLPMNSKELFDGFYGGEEGEHFDWRNITADIDLGDGYDYLLVQVDSTHAADAGDKIAVDNISLSGDANAIAGSIPKRVPGPTVSAPQPNSFVPPTEDSEDETYEDTDTGTSTPPAGEQPIPVEPNGGIGDGAGPLLNDNPTDSEPAADQSGGDATKEEEESSKKGALQDGGSEKPTYDKADADKTSTDTDVEGKKYDDVKGDKGSADKPAVDRSETDGPETDGPEIDGPEIDELDVDKPVSQSPKVEAPDASDPVEEDPMMEKPQAGNPNGDNSAQEDPVMADPMQTPTAEDPISKNPTGQDPVTEATPSIAELVSQSGGEFDTNSQDFDILFQALKAAGLTDALGAADADVTVFAPTDAAFVQLAQDLGLAGANEADAFDAIVAQLTELGNGDPLPALQDVLKYHVSAGAKTIEDLKTAGSIDTLLEGTTIQTDGETLTDADPNFMDPSFIAELSDIEASNGTVQGIDRVLIPLDLPDDDMTEVPKNADPTAGPDVTNDKPVAPQPPVVPSFPSALEPVARLSFEETSGRLAVDSSTVGMDNSGYLRRGTKRIDGKLGRGVSLSGVGDVVTMNNSKDINLDIHGQRTLSMWFNADDAAAEKKQVLYEEGGLSRGMNVYLEDGLLNVGGWNQPSSESGWGGSWLTTEAGEVKSGSWHHVALVLDGTEELQDNALTAYLDGEEIGSMDASQLWRHAGRIGVGNISGKTRFEDGIGSGRRSFGFAGGIDEVAIYNDVLGSDQVKQLSGGVA